MRLLLLLLALSLTGCVTRIRSGNTEFCTYANARHMRLTAPGIDWEVNDLDHSTPTTAASNGTSRVIGTAATAAIGLNTAPAAVKIATMIPTAAQTFRNKAVNIR